MKVPRLILAVFLKSSFLFCSDGYTLSSFHLVDGNSPNEGRVEVTVRDDDGDELSGVVVSDDSWTNDAANWVCEELGYRHAAFVPDDNRFGRGAQSQIFSLDNQTIIALECDSDESVSCSEIEAAGVICQKPGYLGCFRIRRMELSQSTISETTQIRTNDACLEICRNLSAPYAAQRDDVCYCLNGFSTSFPERTCNERCNRNSEQFCGRSQRDSYIVFNVSVGFCPGISGVNLNVYGWYRFGDMVRANCSGGLRLMGDGVLQCIGDPDFFDWNGTIPTCVDRTTMQPRTTDNVSTVLIRRTMTHVRRTTTGFEIMTDATTMDSVGMRIDSGSKSTTVQVVVSLVVVLMVAILAVLLVLYVIRSRKAGYDAKQDESKSSNTSCARQTIPNIEGPGYYEVGQTAVIEYNHGLIDNVLYKPAGDVRKDTNEYELDRSSPNDIPHYGLVDNVLYKPIESTGIPNSNNYEVFGGGSDSRDDTSRDGRTSGNFRQLPKGNDLPSEDPEYASPDEHECRIGNEGGESIGNIIYTSVENHTFQISSSSGSPLSSNLSCNGTTDDAGHYTAEIAPTKGPRLEDRTEITSPSNYDYATVDKVFASNEASDNPATEKRKSFSCYASVRK